MPLAPKRKPLGSPDQASLCYSALTWSHIEVRMAEATFTFRVDDELKSEFAAAAKAQDRTGAQLLRDYMRAVVVKRQEATDYDAWFRREVQKGIDAAQTGNVIPNEEVEAEFAMKRAQLRRKLAKLP